MSSNCRMRQSSTTSKLHARPIVALITKIFAGNISFGCIHVTKPYQGMSQWLLHIK